MSSFTEIVVEGAGAVTTITLAKPKSLNALGRVNSAVFSDLWPRLRPAWLGPPGDPAFQWPATGGRRASPRR
jgi:hypothetical protein